MPKESLSKFLGFGRDSGSNQEQVVKIPLDKIQPNPYQPRKHFDATQLEELSRSIKEMGLIQPIVLRGVGDRYEIVAGERRFRASQMAGLSHIPAVVRAFTDLEVAEVALVENLQRADLSYFEEAVGYERLIKEFSLTQEEVAQRVGKSQPTIANKMRLLKLDAVVRENIMVELITERHLRALLKLKTPEEQLLILREIYQNELNVRETDQLVDEYLKGNISFREEETSEQEPEKKQRIRRVFKDMRLYLNTIKSAIHTIEEAGLPVKMTQADHEEYIELTIRLPRIK